MIERRGDLESPEYDCRDLVGDRVGERPRDSLRERDRRDGERDSVGMMAANLLRLKRGDTVGQVL